MSLMLSFPSIFPVTAHTDYVGAGSTFVVIQGFKDDGAVYIIQALEKGAKTIVINNDLMIADDIKKAIKYYDAQLIRVENTRKALGHLCAQAAGFPGQKLKLYAVTGTKGKSTTVFLLEHILRTAGFSTALLSTVKNKIGTAEFAAPLTTAQPDYLHQFFALCLQQGVTHVVMEVAAQAMTMYRVEGLSFDGVVFTNFSREHLEFYQSLDEYFAAKLSLFSYAKSDAPLVINGDDSWLGSVSAAQQVVRFGFNQHPATHFFARSLAHQTAIEIVVEEQDDTNNMYRCSALFGQYNGYNMLAAIALARTIGVSKEVCSQALEKFTGVPGRLEQYRLPNGALCVIDCAHNPASFEALLSTLRPLTQKLIIVFGAGGDRDPGRRPLMGALAAEFADLIVITADNPRSEDPASIAQDIVAGISLHMQDKVIVELDRELAIKKAYERSGSQAIIALLGKADADYQIFGTKKIHFSERSIIRTLV